MSVRTNNGGIHILVFPYPAQGHMLPLLDLTHQLSLQGLTITILITPKNLPILNPILTANPSIQTLVLPFPSHPSVPPGVENVKDLGNSGNVPMICALTKLQPQIIRWFESHSNPPVAMISDFFLGWTHHMAQKLGIPRIVFYSSGAFYTAVSEHLWCCPQEVEPGCEIRFQDLPGVPVLTWEQVPSLFRRYREAELENPDFQLMRDGMVANELSWASAFNTFEALEDEFLDYLRKKRGHPLLFSVGPLNLVDMGGINENESNGRVLSWLNQCADGSVLYVCFGSQKLLKKAQVDALANAIDKSGVRFIWVMKPLTAKQVEDGFGPLPDWFEDRVKGRGIVIQGWADQVSILNHRAVGGFLSHCGWNSVLEAIAAGVMILGWPMEADQFVDIKLLVDYKRAALQVCEGASTVPDSTELAQVISMAMKEDVDERVRAKKLKHEALEAVKTSGDPSLGLEGLVKKLVQLEVKGPKGV